MLKRGTWLLLLSAIALTGGVLLLENRSEPRSESTAENEIATESLFPFEEEEIEQFSVVREVVADESEGAEDTGDAEGTEELSFVKGAAGSWEMSAPESAIAQNGAIAFLLSQVTTTTARPVDIESDGETPEASASLEPYGLEDPIATVALTANGNNYQLHVGGLDFAGDQRYVQAIAADSEEEAESEGGDNSSVANIYLISGSIITAINRPIEDWILADETTTNEAAEGEGDIIENPLPDEPVEDSSESVDESGPEDDSESEPEPEEEAGPEEEAEPEDNSEPEG